MTSFKVTPGYAQVTELWGCPASEPPIMSPHLYRTTNFDLLFIF